MYIKRFYLYHRTYTAYILTMNYLKYRHIALLSSLELEHTQLPLTIESIFLFYWKQYHQSNFRRVNAQTLRKEMICENFQRNVIL